MSTEIGSLTADDLGLEVTITEGGSVHAGILRSVQHDLSFDGLPRTMVSLRADSWRHVKTYPSDTPCLIAAALSTPGDA